MNQLQGGEAKFTIFSSEKTTTMKGFFFSHVVIFLHLLRLFSFIAVVSKCFGVLVQDFNSKSYFTEFLTVLLSTLSSRAIFRMDFVGSF